MEHGDVRSEGFHRHALELLLKDGGESLQKHLALLVVRGRRALRGDDAAEADQIFADALALQEAGIFALVLEKIPVELAGRITNALEIPTIGIGAGSQCDGQILVTQDMIGLFTRFRPRFVRRYLELGDTVVEAFGQFVRDVKSGEFPNTDESY